MSELLDLVLRAHGGLDRWNSFNKVSAKFVAGGGLLPMKGLEADPNPLDGTVTIHEESTVIRPFGRPDWRMMFTPNCVSIETTAGVVVRERANPRAAFAGHTMNTPWDVLHRAYFNGYARWTYCCHDPLFDTAAGDRHPGRVGHGTMDRPGESEGR
jgi:hypothetical protein